MPPLTPADLNQIRDQLNRRLHAWRAEVHAAHLARQTADLPDAHAVEDRKDEAARQQADQVDDAQQARDIAELGEVLAALKRLDAGTYGDCLDCGEPIPLPRLRVHPAAARCAPCQSALEAAERRPQ